MDTTQQRLDWHNAEAMLPKAHVHKFLPAMATDQENDDVYYWGECSCGAIEE